MKKISKIFLTTFLVSSFGITNLVAEDSPNFENYILGGLIKKEGKMTTLRTHSKNRLKIKVQLRNFTDTDKHKLYKAVQILERVMNSIELKEMILNFKHDNQVKFHRNKGLSNQEIYNHLMTGSEDLMPTADKTMNFDLTLYRSLNPFSKVKGYTKSDTMRIWLHKKYYRRASWTPVDVAANLAHEWVHKMGFGHDYYHNEDRPYSVPYAVGSLVGQVAEQMGYE